MIDQNGIVVYGGSFNPPTIAHVINVKYLINRYNPQKILIVPTKEPPHKEKSEMDDIARYRMIKETFEELPGVSVTDLEYVMEGTSFTYKTAELLNLYYETIYMMIGMDSFLSLPNWYKIDEIIHRAKFLVFRRGGYKFRSHALYEQYKDRFIFLENPIFELSSTFVRNEIEHGRDVRYFVTDKTYGYLSKFLEEGGYV